MFTSQMIPLWSALFGGILTISGTLILAWFNKSGDRKHEAQQLARALRGEIAASISIVEYRKYSQGLKQLSEWCLSANVIGNYSVASREDYRVIYKSNAEKLGILPALMAEQISTLYTHAASILEDFKTLDEEYCGTRPVSVHATPATQAARFQQLSEMIIDNVLKAKALVAFIDEIFPEPRRKS